MCIRDRSISLTDGEQEYATSWFTEVAQDWLKTGASFTFTTVKEIDSTFESTIPSFDLKANVHDPTSLFVGVPEIAPVEEFIETKLQVFVESNE